MKYQVRWVWQNNVKFQVHCTWSTMGYDGLWRQQKQHVHSASVKIMLNIIYTVVHGLYTWSDTRTMRYLAMKAAAEATCAQQLGRQPEKVYFRPVGSTIELLLHLRNTFYWTMYPSTHNILPTHGKKHQVYWPGAPTTVNHCVRPAYFLPTYRRIMFSSVRVDQEHLCKFNTIKNPSSSTMDHVNIEHIRALWTTWTSNKYIYYIPMLVVNIPSSRIYSSQEHVSHQNKKTCSWPVTTWW